VGIRQSSRAGLNRLGWDFHRFTGRSHLDNTFKMLKWLNLEAELIIDVGAHSGNWTVTAMRAWPMAKYVLVEPQRNLERARQLKDNPSVVWWEVGAGPEPGTMAFFHHTRSDSSTFIRRPDLPGLAEEEIAVMRIDQIVASTCGNCVPDIIKLDCEGWDLQVLEGAGPLVGQSPCIFLEAGVANRIFSNSVEMVIRTMDSQGYGLVDIGDAARNRHSGVMWNAELCFLHRSSPQYEKASRWIE